MIHKHEKGVNRSQLTPFDMTIPTKAGYGDAGSLAASFTTIQ